jgi:tubulin polyglutamylase TTLL4
MNKTVDILKDVNKFQKCNHFPGVFQIGRKDNLCRNISRLRRVHKYQYDICPQTYLLPEDFNRFNIDRAVKQSVFLSLSRMIIKIVCGF